jgi:hypothetical protein
MDDSRGPSVTWRTAELRGLVELKVLCPLLRPVSSRRQSDEREMKMVEAILRKSSAARMFFKVKELLPLAARYYHYLVVLQLQLQLCTHHKYTRSIA